MSSALLSWVKAGKISFKEFCAFWGVIFSDEVSRA